MDIKQRIKQKLSEAKIGYNVGDKVIYISKGKTEIKTVDSITKAGNVVVNGKTFLKSSGSEFNNKFGSDHIQPFNQKSFDDIQKLEDKFRCMGLGENLLENSQIENKIVEQVRAKFPKEIQLNKEYPITVDINGIKRKFLVYQKAIGRLARLGEGDSKLYLKTLVFGSMLKGDKPEHIWNFFVINEKNQFKEVGYPKSATKEEIETFNRLNEAKGDWRKKAKEAMKHPDYQKNNKATYLNIELLPNGTYGNPYNKERYKWDDSKKEFIKLPKEPEIVVKVSGYNDSQLSYNGTCEACGEQSHPQKLTYYTPDERMAKIKSLIKHKDNCPLK